MKTKWFDEKNKLEEYIFTQNLSYEEIGRIYGCSGTNIKKVAKKIGIELISRRKINPKETFNKGKRKAEICLNCNKEFSPSSNSFKKYCCNKCQMEYQHKVKYQKFLDFDASIQRANYSPKVFYDDIMKEQDNKCAICGLEPIWNGKTIKFIVDHIDGHASHNYRENIRCICSNCDSQLDTYKSRNKNGERIYYRNNHR